MKRVTLWFMSTLSALVLLFSYHTSTNASAASQAPTTAVSRTASSSGSASDAGSSQTTTSGGTSGGTSGSSSSTSSKTYTGSAVEMRYGTVQVAVTVSNGKVTAVKAVDYPMENGRDQEINSAAIPVLDSEATSAKSSSIDMVSGATYTSEAYIQSLQSALDAANV